MTFGDIFSEINLDFSIIYVIILTNLIFLASKFGVLTLNIIWSFLHDRDIKEGDAGASAIFIWFIYAIWFLSACVSFSELENDTLNQA